MHLSYTYPNTNQRLIYLWRWQRTCIDLWTNIFITKVHATKMCSHLSLHANETKNETMKPMSYERERELVGFSSRFLPPYVAHLTYKLMVYWQTKNDDDRVKRKGENCFSIMILNTDLSLRYFFLSAFTFCFFFASCFFYIDSLSCVSVLFFVFCSFRIVFFFLFRFLEDWNSIHLLIRV